MWYSPALTEANSPSGGVAWPSLCHSPSRPPSRPPSPHRCASYPALTEANSPSGGVAWPSLLSAPAGHRPVHPHPAGVVTTPRSPRRTPLPAASLGLSPSSSSFHPQQILPPSRPASPRRCGHASPRSPKSELILAGLGCRKMLLLPSESSESESSASAGRSRSKGLLAPVPRLPESDVASPPHARGKAAGSMVTNADAKNPKPAKDLDPSMEASCRRRSRRRT